MGFLSNIVLRRELFAEYTSHYYVANSNLATVVACVLAFSVAWAFMAVFDVTTDTLIYCYADDILLHHGHVPHAPEGLSDLHHQAEASMNLAANKAGGYHSASTRPKSKHSSGSPRGSPRALPMVQSPRSKRSRSR